MRRLLVALGTALLLCGPALAARVAGPATADDIRDIRGPIPIPSPWRFLAWGALAVAAAGLGWGIYRLVRRLARRPERPRLPHEIALARLEVARKLMYAEQARAFSIEVSEAVRAYIEARFHLEAAHRTTEEFLYGLMARKDNPLGPYQDVLGAFLSYCDLGKFARWLLSLTDMEGMLASARDFITQTAQPQLTGEAR